MAKLVIVNKNKAPVIVKSFRCNITKSCTFINTLPDNLYHNGIGVYPIDGDIIYFLNDMIEYEIFKNNTAIWSTTQITATSIKKSFKTDFKGECTIITCN
jgi:hypothetical protein